MKTLSKLSKLTNAEKIEILEEAKRRIQENPSGICWVLGDIIDEKYNIEEMYYNKLQKIFGMKRIEAMANFNARNIGLSWWRICDIENRIKYIDHLISKLK